MAEGDVCHSQQLRTQSGTPTSVTPIYSLCYFREQKRGSQGHGWIHEKEERSPAPGPGLNGGLSHLERPVYSPSIMALIF